MFKKFGTDRVAFVLALLAIQAGSAATLEIDDPVFQSTWTHISKRIPQGAGMPDEMVSAEVFRIYPGGNFSMFLGGLIIDLRTGATSISEGTPIQGYVGRWTQTVDGLLVAYIKTYEWPKGLSDVSGEKLLARIHIEEIIRDGEAFKLKGRRFDSATSPTPENFREVMGGNESMWKSRKELLVRLDSALMQRAAENSKSPGQ